MRRTLTSASRFIYVTWGGVLDLELIDKGIPSRHTEGNKCTCINGYAHEQLIKRVDASFLQDAERYKLAPTSETMRAKVLSTLNGHH